MLRQNFLKTIAMASGAVTIGASLQAMAETLPEDGNVMPAFFIGHGSPMNALGDNEFTRGWKAAMEDVPKPKAILCVSAHWLTRGTWVTAMDRPKTIHDFGGFPRELSEAQYAAPGDPKLAGLVSDTVKGTPVGLDQGWGLDHGTWSVLKPVFPMADIPVVQVSIDIAKPGAWHYGLAKELMSLRRRGVLIIGSGNIVHNLGLMNFQNFERGFDWAIEIDETIKQLILNRDHGKLCDYRSLGKSARLAIPTPDHYYPLLYALALQDANEEATIFNDKAVAGSITMTSVRIG
ncbi:4,5-DOPA-extradiol-dioxygenase [Rhodopirellula baltica]|jgi:4,5-DOPA dioxygenase extradiol|uniref:Extradiol ring-cleavage dioxygenase class III protein subunit B n=1 Tax=Rhodopirellula baltica SWK14 TaxID=993516 RepID=L7C9X9_RHOBT|nr:4,5-DOPA dioxygenase extradiol [Rhodopirellula baltica]ELP29916.1 Extradiol ring-cleavage dioxygenase class III protein subunit B [Rhodopirellula baltica SWK14]